MMASSGRHPDPEIAALVETATGLLEKIRHHPPASTSADSGASVAGHGINATQYEALYDICCGLCNEGHFRDALAIALQLTIRQPFDSNYNFLAGSCAQQMSLYSNAARFFALSMLFDPQPAAAAFRMGECFLAMDFREEADRAFDAALAASRGDPEARALQDSAYEAIQMLRMPH